MASNEGTIYLPKQRVRPGRGKPGYKGKDIKVVADPSAARAADEAKAAKVAERENDQKLTPKQQAVAEAESLGLSTDGTEAEIRERIAAHKA